MTRRQLSKLQVMISRRLDRLVRERFPDPPRVRGAGYTTFLSSTGREKVEKEWTALCSDIGILRITEHERPVEPVVVHDPMPEGEWLEMSEETATKILTLGMP